MKRKAWQIEREIRLNAVPMDRRIHASDWFNPKILIEANDILLKTFWKTRVPGSGAPEFSYLEMVQAMANKGYDVSVAEELLQKGLVVNKKGDFNSLRAITGELLNAVINSPTVLDSTYHKYKHPASWRDVRESMSAADDKNHIDQITNLGKRIYDGWMGQLAGASFGTAIEGYTGERIAQVYGEVQDYITKPETMNDDVVYELIFMDVFQRKGRVLTSHDIALEWLKQIPFGWSAEWIALQNLRQGIFPPHSGAFRNPFSNWIGAQMRGMICGMLAPGWPLEAARLAHLDGVVSHEANGVYGEIFASVLTSLAFLHKDPQELILDAIKFIPYKSEYMSHLHFVLDTVKTHSDSQKVWQKLSKYFEKYNWIHAYPNMGADVMALWFGEGKMTHTFSLLAKAGLDVDCNGGLVGNVLGIMYGVSQKWKQPIGDLLETYIPGKEKLSIRDLARRTTDLACKY